MAGSPLIVHGRLHAPYFIFLRCAGRYSDSDLLQNFGLADYRPRKGLPDFGRYAILAADGQWSLIADDWHYTLWHKPSTRPLLANLGETCELFACSVGECDRSFDFVYYRDARLVRRYVVADPHFQGGVVVENIGQPLPGESAAFQQSDELEIVLVIARSLGIPTDYSEHDLRIYSPPPPPGKYRAGLNSIVD
jgi:hypothetical protein